MTRVFRIAVLVALVHALDDAFVHRGPGYGLGQHALAGAIAVASATAAVVLFPRLGRGLRAALAFTFGVLALTNGAMHVHDVNVTGIAAAAAGVVLISLAVAITWRGGWKARAAAIPAGLVAGLFVLGPMAMGIVATHKWREPVGAPPSAAYANVRFEASDGLELAGWYRPSQNGAAVVVVHGGSSDRKGSVAHASMLARHGYGVLLYDARGRGDSDGSENNYGWDWTKDIAGALAFLKARDDVDPGRIGALGLSTGADALVDVAAERSDIAALVADGTAAGSFEDWHRLRGNELGAVPGFVMFGTIRVLSGDPPGRPLEDQIRRITSPTLLISGGTDVERDFNVLYDEAAAGGPVEHWSLPTAHHTRAIHEYPQQYEQRVTAFLDDALRGDAR
jgi:pimeloyl-ACP methyl ester carboxylesterase